MITMSKYPGKQAIWSGAAIALLFLLPGFLAAQLGPATPGLRSERLGGTLLSRDSDEPDGEERLSKQEYYRRARAQADADWNDKELAPPPPPPPGTELIGEHMSGEVLTPIVNWWDGVDSEGHLRVHVAANEVLNDVGQWHNAVFPPIVNAIDMNNNGLFDLVVGDQYGYLWIFFNSGEKGAPEFTTGTLMHTFIGLGNRIHAADWNGNGLNDIIIGTHCGQFRVLYNTGTAEKPEFKHTPRSDPLQRLTLRHHTEERSAGLSGARPAHQRAHHRMGDWGRGETETPFEIGIYMTPWVMDWNENGRPDLIFGEGTYSANSVRIALNTGRTSREPVFRTDALYYLAYGEGYEQLVPSILDYNGDGIPDIMVGTRTGEIRLYKGTDRKLEAAHTFRGVAKPAAMEFDRYLEIAGKKSYQPMTAPFPCDWNDNGLFDIIMGCRSGKILLALNQGTREDPYFPAISPIEGTDVKTDGQYPSGWSAMQTSTGTVGRDRHWNTGGYLTSERSVVLKGGGRNEVEPVEGERFLYYRYKQDYPGWRRLPDDGPFRPGNRGLSAGSVGSVVIGRSYTISFSYILIAKGDVTWNLRGREYFRRYNVNYPDPISRTVGDTTHVRIDGASRKYISSYADRSMPNTRPLRPARTWQNMSISFTVPGTQRGQKLAFPDINVPSGGAPQSIDIGISFRLPEGDAEFLLDNFSLKEAGGIRR